MLAQVPSGAGVAPRRVPYEGACGCDGARTPREAASEWNDEKQIQRNLLMNVPPAHPLKVLGCQRYRESLEGNIERA